MVVVINTLLISILIIVIICIKEWHEPWRVIPATHAPVASEDFEVSSINANGKPEVQVRYRMYHGISSY